MRYAAVFSGQGLQHPDMLPWLADDALTQAVNTHLGVPQWRASLVDAEWGARNAHAQCLLTGLALAAWAQLVTRLPDPTAVAGYSVGELAAFSAAGVFDAATALGLAATRAREMDRCAANAPGALIGVSHIAPGTLQRLMRDSGLAIAIRNGVDNVVVGGPAGALERFHAAAVAEGAHCTRLRVAVASHTPAMRPAALAFAQALGPVPMARPRTVLFSNAADRIGDAEQARQALAAQLATTVRWDECMDNLHARGLDCVLEIGAGQALARMWNQRHPDVPARSADEFRNAEAIVQWIRQHGDPA